jgi:hypothetical protein
LRERWFGGTGKRVDEICLDGELDVGDALALGGVLDDEALREAHAQGRPVVVRAADGKAIRAALRRPEVSCVLVPADRRDLLDLDLREQTYG